MANEWNSSTLLWKVTETGALKLVATSLEVCWVRKVVYIPVAADNAVNFQNASGEDVIYLKAGASDKSPVQIDFGYRGKRIKGLTCQAITGTTRADVYLM